MISQYYDYLMYKKTKFEFYTCISPRNVFENKQAKMATVNPKT